MPLQGSVALPADPCSAFSDQEPYPDGGIVREGRWWRGDAGRQPACAGRSSVRTMAGPGSVLQDPRCAGEASARTDDAVVEVQRRSIPAVRLGCSSRGPGRLRRRPWLRFSRCCGGTDPEAAPVPAPKLLRCSSAGGCLPEPLRPKVQNCSEFCRQSEDPGGTIAPAWIVQTRS